MEMTTIRTFNNYISAHILVDRLALEGIQAFLRDEYTVTIDPVLTNAVGGIKVQVPIDQKDGALELLARLDKEYLEAAICPGCGKTGLEQQVKQNPGNILTAILTWLFSSYAVAPQHIYKCANCGYETETLE